MANGINYINTNFLTLLTKVALSDGTAVIVSILLLTLLIEKVLLDAYEGKPIKHKPNGFLIAVVPLLTLLAIIVIFRLVHILSLR